jgi:DNA polymerase III subunit delta
MPVYAAADFLKRLPKEKARAAYVFAGADDYFRTEVRRALLARASEKGAVEVRRLERGACRDFAALSVEARTASMWSPRQMLVVMLDRKFAQGDAEPLAGYLKQPNPETLLVFDWPDPDERLKFAALMKKHAEGDGHAAWVACAPLKEPALKGWLENHVRTQGRRFGPGALGYLLEACGTNLALLVHELDKAFLYAPEEEAVSKETLRAVAASAREFAWWDLTDALGARNAEAALRVLKQLLDSGESPVGLLAVTAPHLRKLLKASAMLSEGRAEAEVLRAAGVRFYGDKFIRQAKAFRPAELERAIEACFEADRALKTQSQVPDRLVIERFVLSLAR